MGFLLFVGENYFRMISISMDSLFNWPMQVDIVNQTKLSIACESNTLFCKYTLKFVSCDFRYFSYNMIRYCQLGIAVSSIFFSVHKTI